jgi:ribosomal protein S18 acetylase RimI-like enzyme
MTAITYRIVDEFPEPAHPVLLDEAFSDYEESALLSDVAREEATARSGTREIVKKGELRIAAFRGDELIGWTYASPEGSSLLYMINSGVAIAARRTGIYTELCRMVIEHAKSKGYTSILSRHAASNNAVIVAKLKLGFFVSGFEYSEVYGPLVRLTYLLGNLRNTLYHPALTLCANAIPLRPLWWCAIRFCPQGTGLATPMPVQRK